MNWFDAIVLGLIQGLTEFLPVSSSAHLRIAGELMGIGDTGAAFTAITQLGTEAAVVVFFWRDIRRIVSRWFASLFKRVPRRDPDARMGWWIILGSIPIVVLGLLFENQIDSVLRSLWFVAIALIVFGVFLGLADRFASHQKDLTQLNAKHAIFYGFAQALALIPGVSRSGGTITAGLLMGYTREAAARYSFLLAIPAVIGSGGYKLIKAVRDGSPEVSLGHTALATVVAFIVALVVIGLFMRYISRGSFMPFVVYRVVLGLVIIALLLTNTIQADSTAAAACLSACGGTL